jgi:hypothetical protein
MGGFPVRALLLSDNHQTFTDTDVLDQAIHHAVDALNLERKPHPLANQRISA